MIRQHHLIRSTLALAAALTVSLAPAAWADPPPLATAEATSPADSQSNPAVRPNPDEQTATGASANPGPCSEVCSGGAGSYGSASQGPRTLEPPALRSASASQLPEIHRQQTAASHAFAYKPTQSARYSSAALNGPAAASHLPGPPTWPTNPTPLTSYAYQLPGPPTWPTNPQPITAYHSTVQATSGGLDWDSAGIGAAGGLAISLLIVGGAVIITHRRQTEPAA